VTVGVTSGVSACCVRPHPPTSAKVTSAQAYRGAKTRGIESGMILRNSVTVRHTDGI
jgi:hypothetical protein